MARTKQTARKSAGRLDKANDYFPTLTKSNRNLPARGFEEITKTLKRLRFDYKANNRFGEIVVFYKNKKVAWVGTDEGEGEGEGEGEAKYTITIAGYVKNLPSQFVYDTLGFYPNPNSLRDHDKITHVMCEKVYTAGEVGEWVENLRNYFTGKKTSSNVIDIGECQNYACELDLIGRDLKFTSMKLGKFNINVEKDSIDIVLDISEKKLKKLLKLPNNAKINFHARNSVGASKMKARFRKRPKLLLKNNL